MLFNYTMYIYDFTNSSEKIKFMMHKNTCIVNVFVKCYNCYSMKSYKFSIKIDIITLNIVIISFRTFKLHISNLLHTNKLYYTILH